MLDPVLFRPNSNEKNTKQYTPELNTKASLIPNKNHSQQHNNKIAHCLSVKSSASISS